MSMGKQIVLPKFFDLFGSIGLRSKGKKVRIVQELLVLHGFNIVVDGDFGPATKEAVEKFQREKGLKVDGIVFGVTFGELLKPFKKVIETIPLNGRDLGEMVVAYAEKHLLEHPREIGGENRGPWVRLYMNGHEGTPWPWCSGFVSFILKQACYTMGCKLPIKTSFSCDLLAADAMNKGRFLRGFKIDNLKKVSPGTIFLSRRSPTDWVHTGIVVNVDIPKGTFYTIEGNTNDEGNQEGYEVLKRTRSFKNKDFILIGD